MTTQSRSPYICQVCSLPLQKNRKNGYRHATNSWTKHRACGLHPVPAARTDPHALRPGTQITIWRPAGTVTIGHAPFRQRFHPGAFDHLVDQLEPLRQGGKVVAYAVITAAQVPPDGSGVLLTMEVIDFAEKVAA